jgi:endonuclease-3
MTLSRRRLATVMERLENVYGLDRHGNVRDGFWEVVYILLSIRTNYVAYRKVFRAFRRRFGTLGRVAAASITDIEHDLRPLGLARLRSRQLKKIAEGIEGDYGVAGFKRLGNTDHQALECYLQTFAGIGTKIAKCVSMYAFDAQSLPVDTHVWRLMTRLGYAPGGRLTEKKALSLEAIVPPRFRYAVHVLSISHGRAVCKPVPKCQACVVADLCPSRRHLTPDILEDGAR